MPRSRNLYQGGRPTAGAGYRARAASRRSSTRSRALIPRPRHVRERQELLASDALTLASCHSVRRCGTRRSYLATPLPCPLVSPTFNRHLWYERTFICSKTILPFSTLLHGIPLRPNTMTGEAWERARQLLCGALKLKGLSITARRSGSTTDGSISQKAGNLAPGETAT